MSVGVVEAAGIFVGEVLHGVLHERFSCTHGSNSIDQAAVSSVFRGQLNRINGIIDSEGAACTLHAAAACCGWRAPFAIIKELDAIASNRGSSAAFFKLR